MLVGELNAKQPPRFVKSLSLTPPALSLLGSSPAVRKPPLLVSVGAHAIGLAAYIDSSLSRETTDASDPSTWSLFLVNTIFHNTFAIANPVNNSAGTLTLTLPAVPIEAGYTLQATQIGNNSQVFATSPTFVIAAPLSSSVVPSSTAASSVSGSAVVSGSGTSAAVTSLPSGSSTAITDPHPHHLFYHIKRSVRPDEPPPPCKCVSGIPTAHGCSYAADMTRSHSQSLATTHRPGAIDSPFPSSLWNDSAFNSSSNLLSIPSSRYSDLKPPGSSRYSSLDALGWSSSNEYSHHGVGSFTDHSNTEWMFAEMKVSRSYWAMMVEDAQEERKTMEEREKATKGKKRLSTNGLVTVIIHMHTEISSLWPSPSEASVLNTPISARGMQSGYSPSPIQRHSSDASKALNDLGKCVLLHSVPTSWPLFVIEIKAGRTDLFYCMDLLLDIRIGDLVIVEADRGKDLKKVINDTIMLVEVEVFQKQQKLLSGYAEVQGQAPTSPNKASLSMII
ncbi:hypothetical protein BDY19DRAFT_997868 [Irpex rosettiformis]|uniref:Uncharacterized protein n=1 Tax=Irpex rosettiformis TaxID=378272 RepID=A0ACB8TQG5_9APHY|nr:hypothetical protein BDY19DRAFT_997868 [Irpex rosettiformis]